MKPPKGTYVDARVPGRDEVVLVRDDKGKWLFERYTLAGKRLTSLDTKQAFAGAEPVRIELPKKYAGEVAKIFVADQSAPFSFFVRDRQAPSGVFETVGQLAGKPLPPERRVLHPEASRDEVAALARRSTKLAVLAARRARTWPELLDELSRHAAAAVRVEVAKAPLLAEAALRRLAGDTDPKVRLQIAFRADKWDIRTKAMQKRAAPPDVIEALTEDPDPHVRRAAWKRRPVKLAAPADLGAQPLPARLAAVRWGIPVELERQLARDASVQVRLKLADSRHPRKCGRRPNIDAEALALLANDKSAKVRAAAALLTPFPARRSGG